MTETSPYIGIRVSIPKTPITPEQKETIILDTLVDKYPLEVPQEKIDNEINIMTWELFQALRYDALRSGITNVTIQQDIDEQMDDIKKAAFRQVKLDMILDEIILAEKFVITAEELEAEAEAISKRQNTSLDMIKGFLGKDLGMLQKDLLIRKAVQLVCSNAIIMNSQPENGLEKS